MAIFKSICIVDDDELFLLVSKAIMQDENFAEQIHNFEDGRVALDYLKSIDSTVLPEVLLLDINMPMMDGWEFMEALEKLKIKDKMKIYITSSSINPLDLEKAEKHPFISGFISKPMDPKKLRSISEQKM